jgi:hypothetical protein
LTFSANAPDRRKLSEWTFRQYWDNSKSPSERHRFRLLAEQLLALGGARIGSAERGG